MKLMIVKEEPYEKRYIGIRTYKFKWVAKLMKKYYEKKGYVVEEIWEY